MQKKRGNKNEFVDYFVQQNTFSGAISTDQQFAASIELTRLGDDEAVSSTKTKGSNDRGGEETTCQPTVGTDNDSSSSWGSDDEGSSHRGSMHAATTECNMHPHF